MPKCMLIILLASSFFAYSMQEVASRHDTLTNIQTRSEQAVLHEFQENLKALNEPLAFIDIRNFDTFAKQAEVLKNEALANGYKKLALHIVIASHSNKKEKAVREKGDLKKRHTLLLEDWAQAF